MTMTTEQAAWFALLGVGLTVAAIERHYGRAGTAARQSHRSEGGVNLVHEMPATRTHQGRNSRARGRVIRQAPALTRRAVSPKE